jgi:type IV pilus assembly protein PilM
MKHLKELKGTDTKKDTPKNSEKKSDNDFNKTEEKKVTSAPNKLPEKKVSMEKEIPHNQSGNNSKKAEEKKVTSAPNKIPEKKVGMEKETAPSPKDKEEKKPANKLKLKKSEVDKLQVHENFNLKLDLFKRLNARSGLALDIDNDKISYIKFKKSGKEIQIEKCGVQNFDHGYRLKAMQLTLTKLKSRFYKHGMKVYVSFFSPDVNIRQIILPKTKKKSDLEKAIFFKNQNDLANFNNESSWNYQILEEFSEENIKKLRILVTTVPHEVVRKYMEILISTGLRPEKLLARPLAISTAYNSMVKEPENDLVVIISTGFTQICYFRKGKLNFFRNVAIGTSNIQKAMADNDSGSLNMNDELKELAKRKDNGKESNLSSLIKERLFNKVKESTSEENSVIKMLHSEIIRSREFVNRAFPDEKIKRIFVSGNGVQLKSLVDYLQMKFNNSIILLRPQFANNGGENNKYSEYFIALGTALQEGNEFNIVPVQYKTYQILKNLNILLIAFLFLCIGGAIVFSFFQRYDLIKSQNKLAGLRQQYQVLNPIQTKYEQTVLKYGGVRKEIGSLLGVVKKTPELLEVLRLFSNETPPFIILNELNFDHYKQAKGSKKGKATPKYKYTVTLSGQISSDFQMGDVVLINFMNHLNELNYFKEIKMTNKRKELDRDLFEFWLELYL